MKKNKIRFLSLLLIILLILFSANSIFAQTTSNNPDLSAPSGILMEAESGQIVYAKDKDTRRSPASVTKIMTLLLIFDNLKSGNINLNDVVTTSAHAKSMGGSQVFLEEGETQTVETLIKCIVIASGNDASVAMAEFISGTEEDFVRQMNERAKELKMQNTHFLDCCGLTDSDEHYTTAEDIAIMSRELITLHPEILKYSSIWMENIIHETRQGTTEFGLTNTNRLIRTYPGCVGLKTGSTSKAKFCLCAVAARDGITLISVVMAAPDYKARLKDAAELLDYGFSKCSIYKDDSQEPLPSIPVKHGIRDHASLEYKENFRYLSTDGTKITNVQKTYSLPESTTAPVKKGSNAGEVIYISEDGKELGRTQILYADTVRRLKFTDCIHRTCTNFLI